jgi:DNA-directed RNA polymerase specialized sigma24 family protein
MMSLEHNPEDAVLRGDVSDVVRSALSELPPEQRRAVVLAAVYGRTALEVSEEEGIPLGTAKTRIRTGLMRLRAAVSAGEGNRGRAMIDDPHTHRATSTPTTWPSWHSAS